MLRLIPIVSIAALVACGAATPAGGNTGDTSSDAGTTDAGSTTHDGGADAGHHADAGHPAGTDAGNQGGHDAGSGGQSDAGNNGGMDAGTSAGAIQTVFVILMENHNWSAIKGSTKAPYINGLLATGAHAENYNNVPGIHPSEPNYLWIEAGTNFSILADGVPANDHQSTVDHFVTQLDNAGISWKSYQEGISGTSCPLTATGEYAPKHNPMIYFDDITNTNDPQSPVCHAHVRPYTEFAADLAGTTARYNFITPNLCDDMHTSCAPTSDEIIQGDNWLKSEVPKILNSNAYKNGGVLFITWDESESGDHPIGFIALSPKIKVGYTSNVAFSHSSLLRTNEEIFGMSLLRDAASATDLADLFTTFP